MSAAAKTEEGMQPEVAPQDTSVTPDVVAAQDAAPMKEEASAASVEEEAAAAPAGETKDAAVKEDGAQEVTAKEEDGSADGSVQKEAAEEESKAKEDDDGKPQNTREPTRDRAKNKKFDAASRPVTDDPVQIRTQIHFYFSNSNLPRDKHMWQMTGGSENLPVKLKDICSFNRMRSFQPYEAVVAALKDSDQLNISGEAGEEVVTRKVPYTPDSETAKERENRTIYAKGFGEEEPSTQFDLEALFTKYGALNSLRLRRDNDNMFKGSVFVEFESEEVAKKFLETDPAPTWKGQPLKIMSKGDYVAEKNEQIRNGEIMPNTSHRQKRFWQGKEYAGRDKDGRGQYRGRGGRDRNGNRDRDDWKKRRDDDQKNGFRDKNNRGGRGGRGRGGRGGRDDRRDNQRDNRGSNHQMDKPHGSRNGQDVKPVIHTSDEAKSNGKRTRDEDGAEAAPPAKKVDTKTEDASAAASS